MLALFTIIGHGYLAKHSFFDIKMLPGLNHFLYYLAVPALLFNSAFSVSLWANLLL